MRKRFKVYKKPCAACKNSHSTRMSTSWDYGDVSPARYPNPARKRKSGPAKDSTPVGEKKKEKENEALVIQNMKPVGLKKNEVIYLGEMPNDNDPAAIVEMMKKECHDYIPNPNNPHCREDMVEVVQEGVSYSQPDEEETHEAVQELMNELSEMVDQGTQTLPKPTLEGMFHSKVKLVGVYDSPEAFSQAMEKERKPKGSTCPPPEDDIESFTRMVNFANTLRAAAEDYMACPHHRVRSEERKSQKGWEYLKCPRYPCLLFCPKEKAVDYMREVDYRPHPDVRNMWSCLLSFCREPAMLQQSQSQDNPGRMFLTCSKKKCNFFRWTDKPLGPKYRDWLQNKEEKPEHPLLTRDADGYPLRRYDTPGPPPPSSRVRRKEDVE